MTPTMFGLAVFLICVLASRQMSDQAFRILNDDQQLKLVKSFSKMRVFSLVPVLIIGIGVWGLPLLMKEYHTAISMGGLILVTIYLGSMHVMIRRRLRDLNLPPDFDKKYLISRHVGHLGMLFLFMCALWEMSINRG